MIKNLYLPYVINNLRNNHKNLKSQWEKKNNIGTKFFYLDHLLPKNLAKNSRDNIIKLV